MILGDILGFGMKFANFSLLQLNDKPSAIMRRVIRQLWIKK